MFRLAIEVHPPDVGEQNTLLVSNSHETFVGLGGQSGCLQVCCEGADSQGMELNFHVPLTIYFFNHRRSLGTSRKPAF